MALSRAQKRYIAQALKETEDDYIRQPLWDFAPLYRPFVIHERRRRFGVDEETSDPEYS
ncbi:hypothetical protein ACFU7T_19035 [Streptomyces sp. NPDC057555]|uniref:hypothetical protein n=1 Tax=Streptomyces sp. NPDC057555 TaxID=3346166 RepID=UPI0036986F8E